MSRYDTETFQQTQDRIIKEALQKFEGAVSINFKGIGGVGMGYGCARDGSGEAPKRVTLYVYRGEILTRASACFLRSKYKVKLFFAGLIFGPKEEGPSDYSVNRKRGKIFCGAYGKTYKFILGHFFIRYEIFYGERSLSIGYGERFIKKS